MNVFVIGIGLIGGSLVLDIKANYSNAVVYGIDKKEEHLNEALALGVIDHKATFSDFGKSGYCYCVNSC